MRLFLKGTQQISQESEFLGGIWRGCALRTSLVVDELTTGPASHSSASLDCQPNDYNPGKMLPRNRQFFKHQEELGNYACKPKHDYQGLLGMGRGVVGLGAQLCRASSPLGCRTARTYMCGPLRAGRRLLLRAGTPSPRFRES